MGFPSLVLVLEGLPHLIESSSLQSEPRCIPFSLQPSRLGLPGPRHEPARYIQEFFANASDDDHRAQRFFSDRLVPRGARSVLALNCHLAHGRDSLPQRTVPLRLRLGVVKRFLKLLEPPADLVECGCLVLVLV